MPFGALALLSACLRREGIETLVLDVNAEAFRALIAPDVCGRYLEYLDREIARLGSLNRRSADENRLFDARQKLAAYPRDLIANAHSAFRGLRQRETFLDPEKWSRLDRTLRAAHAFLNSATPSFDPRAVDFRERLFPYLAAEAVDPYTEYYEAGLVPRIRDFRPDLIAWTCPFSPQIGTGMYASKILRRRFPDVPFLMGGTGIGDAVEEALEDPRFYDYVDYAIVGDGEEAIVDLCRAIAGEKSFDDVPGLYRRDRGKIVPPRTHKIVDMNLSPIPDYRGIDFSAYAMPEPAAVYITSRGCYYGKCTFCPDSFREGFRKRSPEIVYEQIENIVVDQGIRHIHFFDPLTPPVTLEYVSKRIAAAKLPVKWYAEVKFEPIYMNKAYVEKLAAGGCRQLQFGLESGVQHVLDAMDKGNRLDQIEIILDNLYEAGITTAVTWFIGFPNEKKVDAEATWRFIVARRQKIHLSLFVGKFGMGHGEIVYLNPEKFGIRLGRDEHGFVSFTRIDGGDWDVEPMTTAFNARTDVLTAAGGAGLYYAAHNPRGLLRIRGLESVGPTSFESPPIAERTAQIPRENHWIEMSPNEDGSRRGAIYAAGFGEIHDLDGIDLEILASIRRGQESMAKLIAESPDATDTLRHLERLIDRGCIKTFRLEAGVALERSLV